ncbi:hypothetical protein D3C81_2109960 [compost metagenome]
MRFLGKRVRITDNASLRKRMAETASKVLARYAESEAEGESESQRAQYDESHTTGTS